MSTVDLRSFAPGDDPRDFVRAARTVFEGDDAFVPPLTFELKQRLSPKNPFFEHGEARYFVALRNGAVVGRVSASVDPQ